MEDVKIQINLRDGRKIRCALYPEVAPKSVAAILKLIDSGFYHNIIFHRVIENFMIQCGGFVIDGFNVNYALPAEEIPGEFASNGFDNKLKHSLGVLSLARTSDPNSASSQFFICVNKCPHLDGNYAAFGEVIDGESIKTCIDISKVETYSPAPGFADFPCDPVIIDSIERI